MRLSGNARRSNLAHAGLMIAENEGLICVTAEKVAERAGVSVATVRRYFHTLDELRQAVVDRSETTNPIRIDALALGLSVDNRSG